MGLILIPSEVTERAEAVRTLLAETVTGYRGVLQVIQNFVNNEELDTDSWNTFKAKALDYHQTIAQGIVAAEDGILEDAAALEQSAGTEELYEDTLKEIIKKLEDEKQQCQDEIQRLQNLRNNVIVGLFEMVCAMINEAIMQLKEQIDLIDQVLKVYQEKLQFLYDTENNTQGLFIESIQLLIAVEAAINDAGVEITGVGERSDGNWKIKISNACAEMDKKIEAFIEEALRTELQIDLNELRELYGEKVVNRLVEIVMESGINRLESGGPVKFVETAICSITGYQIRKVNGKYEYVDKDGKTRELTISDVNAIVQIQAKVENLISVAYGEVGTAEENENKVKYNNWYYYGKEDLAGTGKTPPEGNYPWCAVFVSWCAKEAGMLDMNIPKEASCAQLKKYYVDNNRYYYRTENYEPKAGDVFIHLNSDGTGHTGIVIAFDKGNNKVYTIEGNSGDKVALNEREYGHYFEGFGCNGGNTFGTIPKEYGEAAEKDR